VWKRIFAIATAIAALVHVRALACYGQITQIVTLTHELLIITVFLIVQTLVRVVVILALALDNTKPHLSIMGK